MTMRPLPIVARIITVVCILFLSACESIVPADTTAYSAVKKFTAGNKTPYVVFGETYEVLPESLDYKEIGVASWYGKKFHGRLTSNGETFDMFQVSAAHKSLPIPSVVKVTNLDNGKSIQLRVNDRGPFHDDRLIDLSFEAAQVLGFANQGTAPVVVEAINDVNYPNLKPAVRKSSYFLQLGAFSRETGAQILQAKISTLLEINELGAVEVSILQSESTTSVLHKVWMGPIDNEDRREDIIQLVRTAKLGNPLKVVVD